MFRIRVPVPHNALIAQVNRYFLALKIHILPDIISRKKSLIFLSDIGEQYCVLIYIKKQHCLIVR